jgi:hypothetical protein
LCLVAVLPKQQCFHNTFPSNQSMPNCHPLHLFCYIISSILILINIFDGKKPLKPTLYMNAYWSLVCTEPARSLRSAYTVFGMSTLRTISKSRIQRSMAMTVPVRPVPGLQCTTVGPCAPRMYDLASMRNAIMELQSSGTPWAGQPTYQRCVTSRHKFDSRFCIKNVK